MMSQGSKSKNKRVRINEPQPSSGPSPLLLPRSYLRAHELLICSNSLLGVHNVRSLERRAQGSCEVTTLKARVVALKGDIRATKEWRRTDEEREKIAADREATKSKQLVNLHLDYEMVMSANLAESNDLLIDTQKQLQEA